MKVLGSGAPGQPSNRHTDEVVEGGHIHHLYTLQLLRKDGQASNKSIDTCSKVFVIHTGFPRVHANERIANHVFDERTNIDLSQHKPKRVRTWVSQHDELVTG
jgi:hypothetical protein